MRLPEMQMTQECDGHIIYLIQYQFMFQNAIIFFEICTIKYLTQEGKNSIAA